MQETHTVSIPGWGRSPREGNGNPLRYSCLGNPIDRRAWWATVHGVAEESDTTYGLSSSREQRHSSHSVLRHTISPPTVNSYLMKTVTALIQRKLRHTMTKTHIYLQSILSALMRKVRNVPIGIAFPLQFSSNFIAIWLLFYCLFGISLGRIFSGYIFTQLYIHSLNKYLLRTNYVQCNTFNLCHPPLCMLTCVRLFGATWMVAHRTPLSMGCPRQEYWSGWQLPTSEIFLTQGLNLHLLHWQVDSLPLCHWNSKTSKNQPPS